MRFPRARLYCSKELHDECGPDDKTLMVRVRLDTAACGTRRLKIQSAGGKEGATTAVNRAIGEMDQEAPIDNRKLEMDQEAQTNTTGTASCFGMWIP